MFTHSIKVSFGHCDIAGIVYSPRFFDYCMEAAEQFLKVEVGLDWYAINVTREFANPVMKFEIDFHHTVHIADALMLELTIPRIGNSSFVLEFVARKMDGAEAVECFTAQLVLAVVDLDAKKSMPIPERYRDRLVAYQERV